MFGWVVHVNPDGMYRRVQREVRGVFLDADLDWAAYAARIKQMTNKPLRGMSLLQHQIADATVGGGQAPAGAVSGQDREQQEQQCVLHLALLSCVCVAKGLTAWSAYVLRSEQGKE